MQFDPENKVVRLCAEGMQKEAEGKTDEAHTLFQQAWDIAENDFEAFTAAHYMARNQQNPEDGLKWNLESIERARAVGDPTVNEVFPSLYLNVGKSYETLNDPANAGYYYQLAADCSDSLPPGKYSDMIRMGIGAALERTGIIKFKHPVLEDLTSKWCERKDLRPLSFVLPAYVGNLGTDRDLQKLSSALSYLSATRCLAEDEQASLDSIVAGLATGEI